MFKRSGAISLALLYTITVLGFALNLHYCGSKVASVKITVPAKKQQAKDATCGMKMDCCKNHHVDVKVKDDHKAQENTSFMAKLFAFKVPKLPFEDVLFSAQKILLEKLFDRGPPENEPKSKVSVYIKNCVYRL
jgi:hypothetical protein